MDNILEKSLDFKRFKNILILNLILIISLFGFIFFESKLNELLIISLCIIVIFLTMLLFSNKGIRIHQNKLILIYSFFGITIELKKIYFNENSQFKYKKFISRNEYQKENPYDKSYHIKQEYHKIYLNNELLITLTKQLTFENAKAFIENNTKLKI